MMILQGFLIDLDLTMALFSAYAFNQRSKHCDWLIFGHVPMFKFKRVTTCPDQPGYNCAVVAVALNTRAYDKCMTKLKMA